MSANHQANEAAKKRWTFDELLLYHQRVTTKTLGLSFNFISLSVFASYVKNAFFCSNISWMSYRKNKWLIGSGGILLVEQQKAATNSNEIQWGKKSFAYFGVYDIKLLTMKKLSLFFSPVLVLDSQKSIE